MDREERFAKAAAIAAELTEDERARRALEAWAWDRISESSDPDWNGYPASFWEWRGANDLSFSRSQVGEEAGRIKARVANERGLLAGEFDFRLRDAGLI